MSWGFSVEKPVLELQDELGFSVSSSCDPYSILELNVNSFLGRPEDLESDADEDAC